MTIFNVEKILANKLVKLVRDRSEIIFHPAIEVEQVRVMNVQELAIKSAQIVAEPINRGVIT